MKSSLSSSAASSLPSRGSLSASTSTDVPRRLAQFFVLAIIAGLVLSFGVVGGFTAVARADEIPTPAATDSPVSPEVPVADETGEPDATNAELRDAILDLTAALQLQNENAATAVPAESSGLQAEDLQSIVFGLGLIVTCVAGLFVSTMRR